MRAKLICDYRLEKDLVIYKRGELAPLSGQDVDSSTLDTAS